MDMGLWFIPQVLSMKASGRWISSMALAQKPGVTVLNSQDSSSMGKNEAKVASNGLMEAITQGSFLKTRSKVLVHISGRIIEHT
jgi:hypothetical protein